MAQSEGDHADIRYIERILLRLCNDESFEEESDILLEIVPLGSWIIKFRKQGTIINNCENIFTRADITCTVSFLNFSFFVSMVNGGEGISDGLAQKKIRVTGSENVANTFFRKFKIAIEAALSRNGPDSPDPNSLTQPLRTGVLLKKRDLFSGWRSRHFRVFYGRLDYFIAEEDTQPRGSVDLMGAKVFLSGQAWIGGVEHWTVSVEPKNHEKPLKLASDILGDEGYADICSWEQVFTIASRPPEHDFDHSDVVRIPSSRPFVGKSSSVHMSADTFGKSRFALFTDWAHRLLLMLAGLSSNVLSVAAAVMLVASVPIARFFFGDQWRFFAPILAGLFLVVWALHAISTLYLAHTKLNDAVISDSSEAQARPDPIRSGKTKQIKKKVSIQPVYSENDGIILPQYKSYPSSMDEQRPSSTGSKLGERLSFRLKAFTGGSLNLDTGSNPKPAVQAPPSASSPKHTRNRIASAFQGLFKGKAASNQVPTTNISPRATDPAASNATEGMSSRGRSISASSSLFFYKDGKEAANPVPDKQRQSIQWIPRSNIRESKEVVKEDQSPSPGRARGVSIPTERDRNDLDDDSIADEYVRASFDSFHGDTIKHDEDDPLHVDQA